jgi:2-polyprenyl-6-methoxyphenol hydroxylase-like FAD-dependent oxidoreductase
MQVAVLVVGAGPTGLGAATRLQQHGLKDWLLIDKVAPIMLMSALISMQKPSHQAFMHAPGVTVQIYDALILHLGSIQHT